MGLLKTVRRAFSKPDLVKEGGEEDIDYLRSVLLDLNFKEIKGVRHYHYMGAMMETHGKLKVDMDEAVLPLSILLFDEPGKLMPKRFLSTSRFDDLYFVHERYGEDHHLELSLFLEQTRVGFLGVSKGDESVYNITLEGNLLEDKLRDIPEEFFHFREPIDEAVREYKIECFKIGEFYHQSKVHTFGDTINQACILTVPGRTEDERFRAALMTFYTHLFDDRIDKLKDPDYDYLQELASSYFATQKMADLGQEKNVKKTIDSMIYGALIQRAKNNEEQGRYANMFKGHVVGLVEDDELKADVNNLHPIQIWLTTHTGLDAFFAVEDDYDNSDLGVLYNLFYAPMLYYHDREEESSRRGEKFRIRFGRELCHGKYIDDKHLMPLIDIFDKHIQGIDDHRREEHFKQAQLAYHIFEPTLSSELRERYKSSLEKLAG